MNTCACHSNPAVAVEKPLPVRQRPREKLGVIAFVFAVALVLRLVVLSDFLPQLKPDVDPDLYRSLARNLVAGRGFVSEGANGELLPQVDRTPVYPLFLAAPLRLGGDRLGLFLTVQCIIGALTCAFTTLLAMRWLRFGAATLAGMLVAIDPNSVVRCADLRAETLFTFLLVAGACFLAWRSENSWGWLCAGLIWSAATLCRPIAIGLWVVAVLVGLWKHCRWSRLAAFATGFASFILLWSARNTAVTGHWFFSTAATYNLYVGRASGVEAERCGIPHNDMLYRFAPRFRDVQLFKDRATFERALDECHQASRKILLATPLISVKQFVMGWFKVLLGPGARGLDTSLVTPTPPAKVWPALYVVALVIVSGAGVVGAFKLGRSAVLLPLLIIYFTLLSGGGGGNSRFRVPVTPMLAVLAVAGLPSLRKTE